MLSVGGLRKRRHAPCPDRTQTWEPSVRVPWVPRPRRHPPASARSTEIRGALCAGPISNGSRYLGQMLVTLIFTDYIFNSVHRGQITDTLLVYICVMLCNLYSVFCTWYRLTLPVTLGGGEGRLLPERSVEGGGQASSRPELRPWAQRSPPPPSWLFESQGPANFFPLINFWKSQLWIV